MKRMQVNCGNCAGAGYNVIWETDFMDEETMMGTMRSKRVECEQCGGKGYTEYAIFSIKEAEAILKHCGLNKE